ncbi:cache domain-containing protein [Streptomyces violens]|uniref:cache domain-containing protein n=1 Tax=Streptomyces violens TaxID=66377 RepID=UPI0006893359|nr:cache and HAMP domain-containing protein [Streptomyces violens]
MPLLGGVGPPIAVLSVLLLALAGLTARTLGRTAQDPVPQGVLTSQQHFAEDGAIAMRASIDESVTDIERVAGLFNAAAPVPADTVLDKLGTVYQKWYGTAVIDSASGRLLAARGEHLPHSVMDRTRLSRQGGPSPLVVRLPGGEFRLLTFALLDGPGRPRQLLVASTGLTFPGISLGDGRSLAVVDRQGTVLSSTGIPEREQIRTAARADVARARQQLTAFATDAARLAGRNPLTAKEPGSGGFPGISGSLIGDGRRATPGQDGAGARDAAGRGGLRAIAGYAGLAGPVPGEATVATGLGLTVVAMVEVPEDPKTARGPLFGLPAAGALLVLGGLVVTLLFGAVQRPLIRLFLESRRLARGDLAHPVTVPRYGEPARIGAALEILRRQMLGEGVGEEGPSGHLPRRRARFGSRALVAVCATLLLVWCVPLLLVLNRAGEAVATGRGTVPQQLVDDQRERTDTLSDRVRRALNEGRADLVSVAGLLGDRTRPAQLTPVLRRALAAHPRYASLYVLDARGTVLARAGGEPHSPPGRGPSTVPVRVLDDRAEEPLVVGTAAVPGRRGTAVVGEFRIDFVNSLLRRPGLGEIRVVDPRGRVIAGNAGYLAFDRLDDDGSRSLVAQARTGTDRRARGALRHDADGPRIVAAAPFSGSGEAGSLGWTVVSAQPVSRLAIPVVSLENRTVLAGLLGTTAAVACLGWLGIGVVRPLRALAGQAEALAGGDRRTVLYPRQHDEVGAIARRLELIRQRLRGGRSRSRDAVPPSHSHEEGTEPPCSFSTPF